MFSCISFPCSRLHPIRTDRLDDVVVLSEVGPVLLQVREFVEVGEVRPGLKDVEPYRLLHCHEQRYRPEALMAMVEDQVLNAGLLRTVSPSALSDERSVFRIPIIPNLGDVWDRRPHQAASLQDPKALLEIVPGLKRAKVLNDVLRKDEVHRIVFEREPGPEIDVHV